MRRKKEIGKKKKDPDDGIVRNRGKRRKKNKNQDIEI
jgi:hypothetical protein